MCTKQCASFMDIQGLHSRAVIEEKKRLLQEAMAIGFPAQEYQEFVRNPMEFQMFCFI